MAPMAPPPLDPPLTCKYAVNTKKKSAVVALKEVVAHLIEPYLREKIKNTFMPINIRKGVESILGMNFIVHETQRVQLRRRARCALCSRQHQDHKTSDVMPILRSAIVRRSSSIFMRRLCWSRLKL